jgi:hypothetical protein
MGDHDEDIVNEKIALYQRRASTEVANTSARDLEQEK